MADQTFEIIYMRYGTNYPLLFQGVAGTDEQAVRELRKHVGGWDFTIVSLHTTPA